MRSCEKLFAKFKYKVKAEGKTTTVINMAEIEIQNPSLRNWNNLTEPNTDSIDQTSNIAIIGKR